MAAITITLNEAELQEAIKDWVLKNHAQTAKDRLIRGGFRGRNGAHMAGIEYVVILETEADRRYNDRD